MFSLKLYDSRLTSSRSSSYPWNLEPTKILPRSVASKPDLWLDKKEIIKKNEQGATREEKNLLTFFSVRFPYLVSHMFLFIFTVARTKPQIPSSSNSVYDDFCNSFFLWRWEFMEVKKRKEFQSTRARCQTNQPTDLLECKRWAFVMGKKKWKIGHPQHLSNRKNEGQSGQWANDDGGPRLCIFSPDR